jgi:hypothetical protein
VVRVVSQMRGMNKNQLMQRVQELELRVFELENEALIVRQNPTVAKLKIRHEELLKAAIEMRQSDHDHSTGNCRRCRANSTFDAFVGRLWARCRIPNKKPGYFFRRP